MGFNFKPNKPFITSVSVTRPLRVYKRINCELVHLRPGLNASKLHTDVADHEVQHGEDHICDEPTTKALTCHTKLR